MAGHPVTLKYDREADAIYVRLSAKPYAFGEDVGLDRRVDYAADGTPVGVELLSVSHGVDLGGLPSTDEIAGLLEKAGVKLLTGP
jgi:uncharacterized protein YuzE